MLWLCTLHPALSVAHAGRISGGPWAWRRSRMQACWCFTVAPSAIIAATALPRHCSRRQWHILTLTLTWSPVRSLRRNLCWRHIPSLVVVQVSSAPSIPVWTASALMMPTASPPLMRLCRASIASPKAVGWNLAAKLWATTCMTCVRARRLPWDGVARPTRPAIIFRCLASAWPMTPSPTRYSAASIF